MADVVLTLQFDTKRGRAQINKLALDAKNALTRAFAVTPQGGNLSKALGIEGAITSLSRLRSLSLKGTSAGRALEQFGGTLRAGKQTRDASGFFGPPPARRNLPTEDILAFEKRELSGRKIQARENEQTAKDIRAAEEEGIRARKSLTQSILATTRRSERQRLAIPLAAEARRARAAEAFAAPFGERAEKARVQRVKDAAIKEAAEVSRVRAAETFAAPFKERSEAARVQRVQEAARAFAEAGKLGGRPGGLDPGDTFRTFLPGKRRGPGGRPTPQQALGISDAATNLLALSSVLGPLNSQLGAVTMQAGFAAFSLGAAVASLSLMASATAGFIALLKSGVTAAQEAGLETREWSRATIKLKLEAQGLLKVIGVKTQLAFAEVVDSVTEMVKDLQELPWDDMISSSANFAKNLILIGESLKKLVELSPAGVVNKTGGVILTKLDAGQEALGRRGKQKFDFGAVSGQAKIGPAFALLQIKTELEEIFGPSGIKPTDFVHTPKFAVENVEDVGMNIQKSILKQAGETPEVRALNEQNNILRENLRVLEDINGKTIDETLGEVNSRVPVLR